MPEAIASRGMPEVIRQVNRMVARMVSSALAAFTASVLTANAFIESFHSARLSVALVLALLLQVARYPRLVRSRELALYVALMGYMVTALLWSPDLTVAPNTLVPALNFLLAMALLAALLTYHETHAILVGLLVGSLLAVGYYALSVGFPFVRPVDFSYNAIAGMYLFGLIVTLVLCCFTRWKVPLLIVAALFLLHIVATTSIKTNLGILCGAIAAGLFELRYFLKGLRRHLLAATALGSLLVFAVASNEALVERLAAGVQRVALGVEVLQARENLPGYAAFEERATWKTAGLKGWAQNPLFGNGVEAFRARYGITSHSTPVDLLYNFGLIGCTLFYAIFACMFWRLYRMSDRRLRSLRATLIGATVCYLFITLSAPVYYYAFLAAFLGIGIGLTRRYIPLSEATTPPGRRG